MKAKRIKEGFVIRLNPGEEVLESLKSFCLAENIPGAVVTGIGAADEIRCGYFDPAAKSYPEKTFRGDLEILSLIGNISWLGDQPMPHLHVVFSDKEMNARGGHLMAAVISATCEIVILPFTQRLERKPDPRIGLNLLDI
jgi:predicted DNA-binding protein with PD1-like motif